MYRCWVDDQPCEVIAPFHARIANPKDASVVERCLPCCHCRAAEAAIADLPRLGHHERTILVGAAREDGHVLELDDRTRAQAEAVRRAARRLNEAGLVWLGTAPVAVETKAVYRSDPWLRGQRILRRYPRRSVTLSPLGRAVVDLLGGDLLPGKRVRWERHRRTLLERVRRPLPTLIDQFVEDVTSAAEWWTQMARNSAALGWRDAATEELARARACRAVLDALSGGDRSDAL
jgi:hypothetical protein